MQQNGQPDQAEPPSAAPQAAGPHPVLLSIPAEREQVVLVRSVAGHIAARHGLSIADLTDLRLAVDEACGMFLLSPDVVRVADTVECRFEERPETLSITVSTAVPEGFEPDTEDVGWIMLGALVDELAWRVADGTGEIALTKHLNAGA
jgi:serine/threonine-protein kinase RsbW